MSNETQSLTIPMENRGLVLKKEIGALQPGEWFSLNNVTSDQEGSLRVRLGSRRYNNAANLGVVHSLAKMPLGGSDSADPRYAGSSGNIFRITGPYSTYVDVTSGWSLADGVRWEMAPYNAGTSGIPTAYFAHPTQMLRDNGAYTPLRRWGIPPPTIAPLVGLADPSLANYPGLVVLTTQSGGTDRLSGQTVSTAVVINGSYYRITPTSMAGIIPGMYVQFSGSGNFAVVDTVDSVSFTAFSSAVPTGTIRSFSNPVNTPGAPHADGTAYFQDFAGSVDWSFGGLAINGYDSNDDIHVALKVSDYTDVQEIRVRVYVNGSSTDYYEKAITPPQTLAFTAGTQTSIDTQKDRATKIIAASLGDTTFPDPITPDVQPVEADPQSSATWVEYDIPKPDFLKVGATNAGGPTSWKKVTSVRVTVITVNKSGSPAFSVLVGAIYGIGGQGPDSTATPLAAPYDYLYTNRDPRTNAEGNPCAPMVPDFFLMVSRRAVQVTCFGSDTSDLTGDPSLTGFGSIAVYRRGGTVADGEYHFVGYTTNPGAGSSVVFIDNQPDLVVAENRILEFDNFAPVPSDLPVPFTATINAVSGGPWPAASTVTFSNLPGGATDLTLFLKSGSEITIGKGVNEEIVLVNSVVAGSATLYLQRTHFSGEQCECDFMPGSPGDIVCQVGDALLVAGDVHNPHKVYRSKAGRPHAFPVRNEATGNVHIQNVGSPSNPINGLAEFNGEVVSLNRSKIYTFQIWSGAMTPPVETAASRGMIGKHLWCRVDDSIWYLSYDGIYAWAGGESISRTEQIRTVFDGTQTVLNGMQPLDYSQLAHVHLEYFQKYVYIIYIDLSGNYQALRCSILDGYRWEPYQYLGTGGQFGALAAMLTERDTGRLIGGVFDNNASKSFITQLEQGTSDAWTTLPTDGTGIPWSAQTGFYPVDNRDLSKLMTDIVLELENPSDSITVALLYDYSTTPDATDTFTITAATGRRFIPLPLQQATGKSTGKEAKVVGFLFSGSTTHTVRLYSITLKWKPLATIQRGRIEDWQDLGHPWDKRIYECTVEYDTGSNASVVLNLDIRSGIAGQTETDAIQTITMTVGGRGKQAFPIIDGVIGKLVRLRPSVASADFKIFDVQWAKEDYPPDIQLFDEWTDNNYGLDQYLQQVLFDVNTNGQNVQVKIQGDGVDLETITVNTTLTTRSFTATLNSQFKARRFRYLVVTPLGAGAMFQRWSTKYVTVPADKGVITHTADWKDFSNPNDKHLDLLWVEYENSGGTLVLQLDVLSGIGRTVETDNVAQFTLTGTGTGRIKQQFAVNDSVTAGKAFRLRPVPGAIPVNFRLWDWDAHFEQWPADIVTWVPWNDFGTPYLKEIQEIAFDVDTGNVAASVIVETEAGVIQTLSITSTSATRQQIVTLNPTLTGKKFRLRITPGMNGKWQMWSWLPHFVQGDPGPTEHSFDFMDGDWPWDKHLKNFSVEYNTHGQGSITLQMDTIATDGVTINTNVQQFTLSAAGRGKQVFAVNDVVCKAMRLYPVSDNVQFQMWKVSWDFEKYPADSVGFTEYSDFGYEHLKYAQELVLDVNTGGVAASVQIVNESGVAQTVSVSSTLNTRDQILTLSPHLAGKKWRLVITPGVGGRFQLWNWKIHFTKADVGPTEHSFDYDALGWPYSKRLEDVVLEWDNGNTPFTMLMDILGGDGTVPNIAAFSFTLAGNGRAKKSFPFPDNTFATMVRLYPQSTITTLRHWAYNFKKYDLPPDTSLFTEPDDMGWSCEKVLRGFTLDIDSGGVACTVGLVVDGVQVQTFIVNSSATDRVRILTVNPNQLGRLFHLTFAPGVNGKAQLYGKPVWDAWKEPCYRTFWDSGEIVLGAAGWRYIRQTWLEYICGGPISMNFYRDGGTLFWTQTLPSHSQRDVERFFLPAINGTALNKSKRVRVTLTATDLTQPFKVYGDGSRIESKLLSNDQRQCSEQHLLWLGLSPKTG